jgi:alpha-tubulin suppressor-like RCC1 family protein
VIIGLLLKGALFTATKGELIMLKQNYYSSSITRFLGKKQRILTMGMFLLLLALPTVSLAATPWYSQGKDHTLTLTEDGKVWALGENNYGQLGNGTFGGESLEPKMINGLDGVIAVLAGGSHSIALKKDGTVWSWGFNGSGQLGDGTARHSSIPHMVAGVMDVKAIATGSGHVVALKNDGTVWAWGGNHSGQIGNGAYLNCMTPTQVPGLRNVTAIVAGAYNTSALQKDGTVWSWGFNGMGQLGNGGNERSSTPVRVAGLDDVRAIAAGNWHMAALKRDGTVWAWGSNQVSQLGKMTASYSFSPVKVSGIANIIDITASVGHTIAIAKNDSVWAWGDAGTGQWGNGISLNGSVSPVQVSGYNGPITVAAVVNPDTILRDHTVSSNTPADAGASHHRAIAQINRSEDLISSLGLRMRL